MIALEFRGGGSLDGAVLELPGHVTGVVTIDRDGRSYYALDGQGTAYFTGFDQTGATMAGFMRRFTEAAKAEAEAVKAASAAQGCSSCGRTFANAAAFAIHQDRGQCLGDTAHGQLISVDGVWDEAWRHPELQR